MNIEQRAKQLDRIRPAKCTVDGVLGWRVGYFALLAAYAAGGQLIQALDGAVGESADRVGGSSRRWGRSPHPWAQLLLHGQWPPRHGTMTRHLVLQF
jgi:hypothetical protein